MARKSKTKEEAPPKENENEEIRLKCEWPSRCTSLERHLNVEANYGSGLALYVLTHMPTAMKLGPHKAVWVAGIIFRKRASDNGVVLNYCPWCGENIQWWHNSPFQEEEKKNG